MKSSQRDAPFSVLSVIKWARFLLIGVVIVGLVAWQRLPEPVALTEFTPALLEAMADQGQIVSESSIAAHLITDVRMPMGARCSRTLRALGRQGEWEEKCWRLEIGKAQVSLRVHLLQNMVWFVEANRDFHPTGRAFVHEIRARFPKLSIRELATNAPGVIPATIPSNEDTGA